MEGTPYGWPEERPICLNPLKRVKFISIKMINLKEMTDQGLNPLKRVKFISINSIKRGKKMEKDKRLNPLKRVKFISII